MEIVSSSGLLAFYKAYLAWTQSENMHSHPYFEMVGLCTNSYNFANSHDGNFEFEICLEMQDQFEYMGLSDVYPFNKDADAYAYEHLAEKSHLNPKRIQWVKDRIADCEE